MVLLASPHKLDSLKWSTRHKFCQEHLFLMLKGLICCGLLEVLQLVRHWSELTQRFPASNGGAVFSISICDAVLQLVTGCDSNSRSSKNYIIIQKTTLRENFFILNNTAYKYNLKKSLQIKAKSLLLKARNLSVRKL